MTDWLQVGLCSIASFGIGFMGAIWAWLLCRAIDEYMETWRPGK